MSLRVDLEKALDNLRRTITQLDTDLRSLENVIDNHMNLSTNKIPPMSMQSLERAITGKSDGSV